MNYKLVVVTVSLILLTVCNQSWAMNGSNNEIIYTKSSQASVHEYEEILKIVECFTVYTNFFSDTYYFDGHMVSRHGENPDDALLYLQEGFSEEVAFDILNYCTYWNQDIGKQVIIPREGIPVFTIDDIKECSFFIEDNAICLKVNYYNCYTLGDHYVYYISAHKVNEHYIINDLRWEANILLAKL